VKRLVAVVLAFGLIVALAGVVVAHGGSDRKSFKAQLNGFQEVPAISSTASGSLKLSINSANTQIAYTLTYTALQGGAAMAAHIHLGQPGVSGGVVAFLCGGGGKAACPAAGGTVSGTIIAADVLALPTQGLAAGDLAAFLRAMRAGVTYVNVHSMTFASGEIRGQLKANGNKD
jgi:hypothetical protein